MIIDKQELIRLLVNKTDLDEQEVRNQLAELIKKIKNAAQEGKEFEIEAFGTFSMEEGMLQFTPSETLSTEINNKYSGMKPIELIGSFEGIDEEGPIVEEQQDQETDDTDDEEGEVSVFDEAFGKKEERDKKEGGFSLKGFKSTPQGGAKPEPEEEEKADEPELSETEDVDEEPEKEVVPEQEEPVVEDEDLKDDLVEGSSASKDSEEEAEVVEPDEEEAFDLAAFTGEPEAEEESEATTENVDISDESEEKTGKKSDEQEILASEETTSQEELETEPTSQTEETEEKTGEEATEETEEKFNLDVFIGPEESEGAASEEKAEEPEDQQEDVAKDKEEEPEPSEEIDYLQHGLKGAPASDEDEAVAEDDDLQDDVVEAGIDQEEELVAEELDEEDEPEPILDKEPASTADKTDGEKPIERILAVAVIVIVIVLVGLKVYDLGLLGNKSSDSTSTISEVPVEQQQDKAPANKQQIDQQEPTAGEQEQASSDEKEGQVADESGTTTSETGDTGSGEGAKQSAEPEPSEEVQNDDMAQQEAVDESQQASQNTYGLRGQEIPSVTEGYTIVVHSFRNNKTASNKKAELQEQGFRVLIRQATVNGTTYYRVTLGQFETLSAAKDATVDLPERYRGNNFIQEI